MKDRFLLGQGSTYATLGGTGGAATVTLATANIPYHRHSIPALSGTAASAGGHIHSMGYSYNGSSYGWAYDYKGITWTAATEAEAMMKSAGAHTHTVSTTASNTGYYGGDSSHNTTAHNNMPPYIVVYIWRRTK